MTSLEFSNDGLALAEKTLELENVLDCCLDGIVIVSGQGLVKFVNSTFLDMTGTEIDELIGQNQYRFDEIIRAIAQDYRFGNLISNDNEVIYCFNCQSSNGDISSAVNQVFDVENKQIVLVKRIEKYLTLSSETAKVIYFRDITEQHHQNINRAGFIEKAAHELRTPMTSIQGFSELLLSKDLDNETIKELSSIIHSQSEYLVNLINQVMEISQIDSGNSKGLCFIEQPVWPIVERAVATVRTMNQSSRLILHQSNRQYVVSADLNKLCRAITKVLENAFKYSPADSEIDVFFTDRQQANGDVEVGIVVRDQGVGMTVEQVAKLFDPFWRGNTKTEVTGIGLGMSLTKAIVALHRGTIEVNSEIGRGTEIALWLTCISALDNLSHA